MKAKKSKSDIRSEKAFKITAHIKQKDEGYYEGETSTNIDGLDAEITEMSTDELWTMAMNKAGSSLFYMQFLHPFMMEDNQAIRVGQMCYHLAAEWRYHFKDIPENRHWFRCWIKKFDDEVENQV